MTLLKKRKKPFRDIFEEILAIAINTAHRAIDEAFKPFRRLNNKEYIEPRYESSDDDENIYMTVELPGVNKEDIHLLASEDDIKVDAKRIKMNEEEYFYAKIKLPEKVNSEETKAKYKNGILEIVLPKKERKKRKKIEID